MTSILYQGVKKGLITLHQTIGFNMCVNDDIDTNRLKFHRCNHNIDTKVEDKTY